MSNKILVLEDDLLFAETLIDLLEDEGYEVSHAPNGQDLLDITYKKNFDLYLLDINVPLIDGLTLLGELRDSEDNTPAIFLTSHKEKEMLQKAFTKGGDDFITKPFDNDELLLRIHALLRRIKPNSKTCIEKLCHDPLHQRILFNEEELDLSQKEYQLLILLMAHVNTPVPKTMIFEHLWSNSESGSDGAIRVYINRIKQLLPEMHIENIRGVGYKLVS